MSINDANYSHQNISTNNDQRENQMKKTTASTTSSQQTNRNISKRIKEGDDSFEIECRRVNVSNKYFNQKSQGQSNINSSYSRFRESNEAISRASFPPFRISFADDQKPSELSILKDINKHCHISLSHGRYSSFGKKNNFLLYANSTDQFERLLDKNLWPSKICNLDYFVQLPSKVPVSYSIVALGIPVQWNIDEFEHDVKNQYPTVVKVERIYVKGGIPISKVRIDFSSNRELSNIIKNKRILLDDENTSYPIQQYIPPLKVLRCYNCQQYNDHVASNCPRKDTPICFRCGQNHQFNPNCQNKICCAHCHQDHLTGSPNCPVKIEERRKCIVDKQASNIHPSQQKSSSSSIWTTQSHEHIATASSYKPTTSSITFDNTITISDISKKLDLVLTKIEELSLEQSKIIISVNKLNQNYHICRNEIDLIKKFIQNTISPYLCQLSEAFMGKSKQIEKTLRPLYLKFKDNIQEQLLTADAVFQSNPPSHTSSPNESIS
jgi:hypothetical protein